MKQQFLNDSGLTELIGYIKKYVKDEQDVKPYASLSVFPKTGEQNIIYIDTTVNASYYWDDTSKTYKALDVQTWATLNGKPSTFPPEDHNHDDRYFTETEMNSKLAGKANSSHKHKKADITDFPTSMPASDVPVWAKASTKPTYTKAEVGLGNVDNTADKDKSVKYATSAGSAGTASSVDWSGVKNPPTTYAPSAHTHGSGDITSLSADKITGVIGIDHLPAGALERCKIVADDTARFKLTKNDIQNGDTVKVGTDANAKMYLVIDDTKLSSEAGYTIYTAGSATSVPWSGVTGKPSTFTPSTHTHSYAGSSSSGGSANSAVKLDSSAGSSTQPVYFSGGKPVAIGYTIAKSVPSNAVFTDTNTWRPLGTTADTACAGNDSRLSNARPASDVYSWAKASTKPSYSWGEISGKPGSFTPNFHTHDYVVGSYTGNGGQQNPNYFGTNKVGFLMMNTTVNGDSSYKDWIIMDCYSGSDVGGGVALGVNRQKLAAYIMRSDASRKAWAESAELLHTSNYTSYTVTKSGSGASGTWGINVTGSAGSVAWGNVSGRPSSMPASDVYSWAKASSKPSYSWSEISGRPSSLPANGGNASTVNGHTVNANVPAGAVFTDTNTWRPCVNNLSSYATDQSLSANQGRALNEKLEKMFPIGYIFIWNNRKLTNFDETLSGAPALTSAQAVHDYFGFGTWQYVGDTFLYGNPNSQGGASTVSLGVGNMPSHTHSIPALSGWAASSGAHAHNVRAKYNKDTATKSNGAARANGGGNNTSDWRFGNTDSQGAHGHNVSTNASTTGSNGSGSAFSIMPPYKGVYIWQRIA